MDEKRTIFDYLGQVLTVFGFAILVLNVFCLIFGNSAKDSSSIFSLGGQGISVTTVFQFLVVSVLVVGLRFLFFTDVVIRKMPLWVRTVCMLTTVVGVMAVFAAAFRWFPIHWWQPWAMFFICFGISFLGSCFVMRAKEKAENRQMEEALKRLKEREERLK